MSLAVDVGQRVNPGAYPGAPSLPGYGMPQQKSIFPSTLDLREWPSYPGAVGDYPRDSESSPIPNQHPLLACARTMKRTSHVSDHLFLGLPIKRPPHGLTE